MSMEVPERQYSGHVGGVYKVVKHPSRPTEFASCSVDCTVCVWNIESSEPLLTLDGHYGYVVDLCWLGGDLGDGHLLATAAYDGTARVWDARSGDCVHALDDGHQDAVVKVSATADGKYLATASHDGFVHVWNVRYGDVVASHEGPGRMLQVYYMCSIDHGRESYVVLYVYVRRRLLIGAEITWSRRRTASPKSSGWSTTIRRRDRRRRRGDRTGTEREGGGEVTAAAGATSWSPGRARRRTGTGPRRAPTRDVGGRRRRRRRRRAAETTGIETEAATGIGGGDDRQFLADAQRCDIS